MNSSINKKIIVETSASTFSYDIENRGDIVYSGKAYKAPGDYYIKIDISKKIKDFLGSRMSTAWTETDGIYVCSGAMETFTVLNAEDGSFVDTFTVLNDWSGNWIGQTETLSLPINGRVDPRMKIFWNRASLSAGTEDIQIALPDYHIEVLGNKEFDYSAQTRFFDVVSDDDNYYSAGTEESWFTLTKQENKIKINVLDNTGSTRSGMFYVTWPGPDFSPAYKYYTVTQDALVWELDIVPSSLTIDYSSGSTTVALSTNGPLSWLSVSGETWLSGTVQTNNTIKADYGLNTTGSARTGQIDIRSVYPTEQVLSSLTVNQDYYYFNMATSTLFVSYSSGVYTVAIDTNAKSVNVTSSTWATASYSNGILTVQVEENTASSPRTTGLPIFTDVSDIDHTPAGVLVITQSKTEAEFLKFEIVSGGTISLHQYGSSAKTISYSFDTETWQTASTADMQLNVSTGDVVYWRGQNSSYSGNRFEGTSKFNVKGDINSLCSGVTKSGDYFNALFSGSGVVDASQLLLPDTTLTDNCYSWMFGSCTSLIAAPALPATQIGVRSYSRMFSRCTSLTTAPELPATSLSTGSYAQMFAGCTNLTNGPSILPALTVPQEGYINMFNGCKKLTTAPEIAATSIGEYGCDSMFYGCTALTTVPDLVATTLSSNACSSMFYNCTSLSIAPELPATVLPSSCYNSMFRGCTALSSIKCLASSGIGDSSLYRWVQSVGSQGTFIKKSGVSWPTASADNYWVGIPAGWTVVEE